jgi:protein involved in polysaccharide export with SLBB domain
MPVVPRSVGVIRRLWAACFSWALMGCAAWFPNPGVPARMVSPEVLGFPREAFKTIDLSLLRQSPPAEYRLDSGDIVGVYIDGVLGAKDEVPPVYQPADKDLPPAVGYPIAVREDGTITLPMLPPMVVRGLCLRELEDRLRHAYTVDQPVLKAGMERILVSLHKPRVVRVLVMRQEEGNTQSRPVLQPESPTTAKRGVGRVVALPAYRNDVLNALAETGGLPGQDADNVVYVLRRNPPPHPASLPQPLFAGAPPNNLWPKAPINHPFATFADQGDASVDNPQVLRIPLRVTPGEPPPFHEQDILLGDGDVVFLESREDERFFTAGLLGGGEYTLPRDLDLDVLGAIAVAESNSRTNSTRTTKGLGGVSALNQDMSVGASKVIVFRKLPGGGEVPIKVDLYRALRHPEERILIQPGDRVVLQYSRGEAVLAFLERHILEGFLIGAATTLLYNRD